MVTDQGLRGLAQLRSSAACALTLTLASAGCTPSLELGDYEFHRSGIAGDTFELGGAGGETGGGGDSTGGGGDSGSVGDGGAGPFDFDAGWSEDAGADSGDLGGGNGGASGSGGAGGSGGSTSNGGAGGTGGSGGTGGTGGGGGTGGSGSGGCSASELCVPTIPVGWTGPIAVSTLSGAISCPGTYAASQGNVNSGLNAPAASCGCGCFVSGVDCFVASGNTGDPFESERSCDSPPTENDCLSAQLSTTCNTTRSETISPATWTTTRLTCGGATSSASCSAGACYPAASAFGQICISQSGDISCPSGFPNRNFFFRGLTDSRSCTSCGCFTQGHSCEIEIELCDVGGINPHTLSTDTGNEICLNSSDGDGVTTFSPFIFPGGTCSTTGGAAQGSAVPTNPVTICCL